jgi:hypothetical protein
MSERNSMSAKKLNRQALYDAFWSWIDPSIEGYSKQIEALLEILTDAQLKKFVEERVQDEG